MDKQTQIMWEEEFLKQYPEPEHVEQWVPEDNEELEVARRAVWTANNPYQNRKWFEDEGFRESLYQCWKIKTVMFQFPKRSEAWRAWASWHKECLDRFDAIFSASPVYALEELRKGSLLIEENI